MSRGESVDSSGEADDREDSGLVRAVNHGDLTAFAVLYRRHRAGAYRAAARWSADATEQDDIVAESFGRLLARFRRGGGPRLDFLPYLIRVIRNVAIDRARKERFTSTFDPGFTEPFSLTPDPMVAAWQAQVVALAFASLPARWQLVLWHVEVEGRRPAALAEILALSPNAVAALAYRAREGLRLAYLQQHVRRDSPAACGPVANRLAAWVRRRLSDRDSAEVHRHLRHCLACQRRTEAIAEANHELTTTAAGGSAVNHADQHADAGRSR